MALFYFITIHPLHLLKIQKSRDRGPFFFRLLSFRHNAIHNKHCVSFVYRKVNLKISKNRTHATTIIHSRASRSFSPNCIHSGLARRPRERSSFLTPAFIIRTFCSNPDAANLLARARVRPIGCSCSAAETELSRGRRRRGRWDAPRAMNHERCAYL